MNRTFPEADQRPSTTPAEVTDHLARQQWVKPTLERLSLRDALTACGSRSDGPCAHSS